MNSGTGRTINLMWSEAAREAAIAARQANSQGNQEKPEDLESQADEHEAIAKGYNDKAAAARAVGNQANVERHLANSDTHLQQAGALRNRADDLREQQQSQVRGKSVSDAMRSAVGKKLGFGGRLKSALRTTGRVIGKAAKAAAILNAPQ